MSELFHANRSSALRYVSRRRADAEPAEELASRPLPEPAPPPRTERPAPETRVGWPPGAPARPIRVDQLFFPGVYQKVMQAVAALVDPMTRAAAEMDGSPGAHPDGFPSFTAGVTRVFKQEECQPLWARGCVWDSSDPGDCVPMQPHGVDGNRLTQGADPEFFKAWGEKLDWPDKEMISQVSLSGVDGHSQAAWDTVVHAHHSGLRQHFRRARDLVEADTQKGWID